MSDESRVADYFVTVGLNNLNKPENDGETLEPITDIAIIFKSLGEQPPEGYECIEVTPSGLPADLNHGSIRTQTCFICYRRGRDKPPLTDIGVLYEGKQRLMHGCDIVHKTPMKQVANVNNGNNMRIFITYRRASPQFAHSSLAVIEICVIIANKSEKPPHAFCLIDKNLNQGLVGSEVYLCYRKSLSRTNSLSYAAEIISRYPSTDIDEYPLSDTVPLFCLPLGAVVECWPESATPPLPIFSTFALTGSTGDKVYGAGVTFFEEFPAEKFTEEVHDLITDQQANQKGQKLVAQTNKCICLLSRYPFFDAFRRFLTSLYRITVSGTQNIPIERYISHFMHNIPFPTPQKPIVYVQITHEGFELHEPSHGPLPISGASFTALLRCLGTENTLLLLHCILIEQKILVHSLRPALLTSVCEALTSMIFPFQWKCPYIPLCPLKLADVLFAPFPFIYGIDSRYFDMSSPPNDVTCVDLDTNVITQGTDFKDSKQLTWKGLPKKPGKVLKDRLDELFLKLYQVANEDNNSAVEMAPLDDLTADKKKKYIEISIQEAFLRFHAQILRGYKHFLLPITSRPDIGSRDVTTLFDLQDFNIRICDVLQEKSNSQNVDVKNQDSALLFSSRNINAFMTIGFVRSRPRGTEKFFQLLTKTQLFSHFIEGRSLSSGNDAVFAFFDECIEKCETSTRLLNADQGLKNFTTVVVTPPDRNGLPSDESYTYNGFPRLRLDLFAPVKSVAGSLKIPNVSTPPRSPLAGRTPHERHQGSVTAKKQANSPTMWARCLLGYCYTIWFIHLPAYVKYHSNKRSVLYKAYQVLQKISESKAKLPDEVCYRVLMQLSGQFAHPALAVKVLFEMKRIKLQPNAITWGYYHKRTSQMFYTYGNKSNVAFHRKRVLSEDVDVKIQAVLEGEWLPETTRRTPKQLWTKVRVAIQAMYAFRKSIAHLQTQRKNAGLLIDISDCDEHLSSAMKQTSMLNPVETASVGTSSDGGYGSGVVSTEDLSRQQPIAGITAFSDSTQDISSKGHNRTPSMTSQSSETEIDPNSLINRPKKRPIARRLSETSIGSNLSSNSQADNSHIIVCQPLDDTYGSPSTAALYDEIGPGLPTLSTATSSMSSQQQLMRSDIALEAVICSCQLCATCDKLIYDEEVMAGWTADESNLNITCPFCQAKRVPTLQIKVKDYRGLYSQKCSQTSLNKTPLSKSISADPYTKSHSNPQLSRNQTTDHTEGLLIDISTNSGENTNPMTTSSVNHRHQRTASASSTNQLEQFFQTGSSAAATSKPMPIRNLNHDQLVSNSAPTSASSSPNAGRRPAFFKHRKSSSTSSSLSMFIGKPEEKVVNSVPYLSPLVLRKEFENMIENDGDLMLQSKDIVTQKPILYWNLVWYFHRLRLRSHLPSLLLQSFSDKQEESQIQGEVVVSTSWDINRQMEYYVPTYMLWNVPQEKQDIVAENGWTPRSVLTTVAEHVQFNDVITPMKILLDERSRQQSVNPEVHWSLYRELMFLSLVSCGVENIDIDAFDREYKMSYKELLREHLERLHPDDKPPTAKAIFCRMAFEAPTLQPRKPKLHTT